MNDKQLIHALTALRDNSRFDVEKTGQHTRTHELFLQKVGWNQADVAPKHYTWKDYFDFYTHPFRQSILRPAMVGLGMLVLVAGGWMTSVSAAYESVPGDFFYPIKIATERAQLTIATSDQKRAELHMDFASRRLAEMTTLSNSTSTDKEARLKTAVVAFKNEVAEAKSTMQNLNTDEAAAIASALDTKTDEYTAVLNQTVETLDNAGGTTEVASAKVDVELASDDAVEVLVSTVEAAPEKKTVAEDLQKSFQNDLSDINSEVTLTLGRIAVIAHVVDNGTFTPPSGTDLHFMSNQLEHVSTAARATMKIFAAGGYRSVFETLDELDATIATIEAQVIELELAVVAQKNAEVLEAELVEPAVTIEPEAVIELTPAD
ncbi:MAG: DUF5667 domain-containing protein [Patescibacteria group bacterium]